MSQMPKSKALYFTSFDTCQKSGIQFQSQNCLNCLLKDGTYACGEMSKGLVPIAHAEFLSF
jgi:hypothetical protein